MYSCINIINVQGAPATTSVVTVCKNGRIIIISDTSESLPLCPSPPQYTQLCNLPYSYSNILSGTLLLLLL